MGEHLSFYLFSIHAKAQNHHACNGLAPVENGSIGLEKPDNKTQAGLQCIGANGRTKAPLHTGHVMAWRVRRIWVFLAGSMGNDLSHFLLWKLWLYPLYICTHSSVHPPLVDLGVLSS